MTPMLDKFEQAVWKSRFAVGIMGNVESGDYELVPLDTGKLSAEEAQTFAERGLSFCGVIALHEDGPHAALDRDFDAQTISALSLKFLKHVERELNARVIKQVAKKLGDELEWIGRIHALPDNRNGMEN